MSSSTLSIPLCRTKLLAAIFLHSYTLHFQIYFTCFPEKAPGVPDPPFCKQKIYCGYVNKQKQIQEIPFRVTGKTCDVLAKVGFIWTLVSLNYSVEGTLCRKEVSKCAHRDFGKIYVFLKLVLTFSKLGLPRKKFISLRIHICQQQSAQGLIILRTLKPIELSHSYLILVLLSLRLLLKIAQNGTHVTWYSRKHTKHIEG